MNTTSLAETIKYITTLTEGNSTTTCSINDFITRLKNKDPTYEFTGDQQTKCNLYFDVPSPNIICNLFDKSLAVNGFPSLFVTIK